MLFIGPNTIKTMDRAESEGPPPKGVGMEDPGKENGCCASCCRKPTEEVSLAVCVVCLRHSVRAFVCI